MGLDIHTLSIPDKLNGFNRQDRIFMGLVNLAYPAGGAAGASVSVALPSLAALPSSAVPFVSLGADATGYVSGGNLIVQPRLATSTLAAGNAAVLILA